MEYIFHLLINSFEGFLLITIISLILFFFCNLILHMFLNFLKKEDELFWPSLINSTKYYAFYIIIFRFTIGIPFSMINIHIAMSKLYNDLTIYSFIFISRFILLSISYILAFISMKNCNKIQYISNKKIMLICFIFCAPYLYALNTIMGVSRVFFNLLSQ